MATTHTHDEKEEDEFVNLLMKMDLNQKPPDDVFSDKENNVPLILQHDMQHPLVIILNKLDPTSFIHFARASKATLEFCLSAHGIRIEVDEAASLCRGPKGEMSVFYTSYLNARHSGGSPNPIEDVENHLAMLKKWRFVSHLRRFEFGAQQIAMPFWVVEPHFFLMIVDTNAELLAVARSFLARIGVVHIDCVKTRVTEASYQGVTDFIMEFGVSDLICWSFYLPNAEMKGVLEQKVSSLHLPVLSMRPSFLLDCSIPTLYLYKTVIPDGTFNEIIEKWVSSPDLEMWLFRYPYGRHFVAFGLEMLGFYCLSPDEADPGCRPLVFLKEREWDLGELRGTEWSFSVVLRGGRVFTVAGYDSGGRDDWNPFVAVTKCDDVPEELQKFL